MAYTQCTLHYEATKFLGIIILHYVVHTYDMKKETNATVENKICIQKVHASFITNITIRIIKRICPGEMSELNGATLKKTLIT